MKRITILLISLALLVGAGVTYGVEYTPPSGVTILTEQELMSNIVGNTLDGRENKWVEYYEPPTGSEPEGNVIGLWGGIKWYAASWTIDGSLMCWSYPEHAEAGGCWTLSLDGNKVTWYDRLGKPDYGTPGAQFSTLLQGNKTGDFQQ